MALEIRPVYDDMVRQFSTSASSTRFESDFLSAFNDTLDDLLAAGGFDSAVDHINSQGETVDDLSPQHRSAVEQGVTFHLIQKGQKHSGLDLATAEALWKEAKGDFVVIANRDLQEDVDDDNVPEEDITGFGYLSD